MEPRKCAVSICNNYNYLSFDVTFHRFPSDFIKARKWAAAINRTDLLKKSDVELKEYFICSNHFTKEMFILVDPERIHLKDRAYPTENIIELDELTFPSDIQEAVNFTDDNENESKVFDTLEYLEETESTSIRHPDVSDSMESDPETGKREYKYTNDQLIKRLPPISPAFAKLLQTTRRRTGRGRQNCCVPRCKNTYQTNPPVKFYRFPVDNKTSNLKRKQWISAVKTQMAKYTLWEPSENSRICSSHFIGGEKSQDPLSPSYVPSIFPPTIVRPIVLIEKKRRSMEYNTNSNDMSCQVNLENDNLGTIIETSFTVCVTSQTPSIRNVEVQIETMYNDNIHNIEEFVVKSENISEAESVNYLHIKWD